MGEPKIVNKEINGISFMDSLGIVGSKVVTEELLLRVPFVGNSTFKSGAIKTGIALGTGYFVNNKIARIVASGVLVDGVEDILTATKRILVAKFGKGGNSNGLPNSEVQSAMPTSNQEVAFFVPING